MQQQELIPHLFRTEYRKIISVLSRLFGMDDIEAVEDIVSDTFVLASETWGQKGIPANPAAWLYAVAKNKALDLLRRRKLFTGKIAPGIKSTQKQSSEIEIDWSAAHIFESQLQMMFAVCHPGITVNEQICLSLNILCGFGAEEIADAFLSNKEAIYKRLSRAKEKLRVAKVEIKFPATHEISERLETVLTTLYLMFSEGYYSTSQNTTLRRELCVEAMRLNLMLLDNELTNTPAANALLSLMCFHSSRFDARTNDKGELILYDEQDETLWNQELIARGQYYLNCSSTGNQLTKFHLEAAIAYWHTHKQNTGHKWQSILSLYNKLLLIEYSPIAALNRTYALAKANGVTEAIAEAEKLQLTDNHFYYALLGELYKTMDKTKAKEYLVNALALAKSAVDRQTIQAKMDSL